MPILVTVVLALVGGGGLLGWRRWRREGPLLKVYGDVRAPLLGTFGGRPSTTGEPTYGLSIVVLNVGRSATTIHRVMLEHADGSSTVAQRSSGSDPLPCDINADGRRIFIFEREALGVLAKRTGSRIRVWPLVLSGAQVETRGHMLELSVPTERAGVDDMRSNTWIRLVHGWSRVRHRYGRSH